MAARKNKNTIEFSCAECGFISAKWLGRCPECGQWDSLVERRAPTSGVSKPVKFAAPRPLSRAAEQHLARAVTGIEELDRVLGGGIVPGAVILIGGDPGIGKSTLLLHMLSSLAVQGSKVLYVTGEESAHQIGIRAERLAALHDNHYLATESSVEAILAMAREMKPALLAVDSIQTLTSACLLYTSDAADEVVPV